jgi:hypothetical protein
VIDIVKNEDKWEEKIDREQMVSFLEEYAALQEAHYNISTTHAVFRIRNGCLKRKIEIEENNKRNIQ